MQIIVVGCGKVGSKFAQIMAEEGHDIVVVDNDSRNFSLLSPSFNGITVLGVPIDEDVLKHAGIETADGLAAVTPDDNINMMACQVAKEIFKVPKVFARIQDPVREEVFYQFGVETICPTNITVDEIRFMMLGEQSITNHTIGNTVVNFSYERIDKKLAGQRLDMIKVPKEGMIFGILRDERLHFAAPGLKLEKDDMLVIALKA
jgi:trk system potassium uptake protein TrkA